MERTSQNLRLARTAPVVDSMRCLSTSGPGGSVPDLSPGTVRLLPATSLSPSHSQPAYRISDATGMRTYPPDRTAKEFFGRGSIWASYGKPQNASTKVKYGVRMLPDGWCSPTMSAPPMMGTARVRFLLEACGSILC